MPTNLQKPDRQPGRNQRKSLENHGQNRALSISHGPEPPVESSRGLRRGDGGYSEVEVHPELHGQERHAEKHYRNGVLVEVDDSIAGGNRRGGGRMPRTKGVEHVSQPLPGIKENERRRYSKLTT
jgi:hypothetical protein